MRKLFIILGLILVCQAYCFGQKNSTIKIIGQDSFALIPLNSVRACNYIFAVNEAAHQLLDTLQGQIRSQKVLITSLTAQKTGLRDALTERNSDLLICRDEKQILISDNTKLTAKVKSKNKTLWILSAVAIAELIVIAVK